MLLLVLILVLIAFALLVVALLSSSVLAAWVSVGLSVVAALVLLVDWLQRRSAMRAGAAAVVLPAEPPREPRREPEPATEVLPVVPPAVAVPGAQGPQGPGEGDAGAETTTVAPSRFGAGVDGPPVEGSAAGASRLGEPVADDEDAAAKTVMMPAVQPSGSPARPSGADPSVTASSGISSPSVTKSGNEPAQREPDPGATTVVAAAGSATAADDHPTVAAAAPDEAERPSGEQAADSTDASDASDSTVRVAREGREGHDGVSAKGAAAVAGASAAAAAAAAASGAGSATRDAGSGSEEPTSADEPTARGADTVEAPVPADAAPAEEATTLTRRPGADEATVLTKRPGSGEDPTRSIGQPGQAPAGAANSNLSGSALFGGGAPAPDADQAQPPPAADSGEPPEEQSDPADAKLVATLADEVIVIDEQPRYHVPGCRSLTGQQPIPIPAREAVDLGFGPCGWCTPDRALASRHPAAAR